MIMTKQRYSQEFKDEAVRLANESEKPTSQIAKELGIKESTLYNWISLSKAPTIYLTPNQSSTHLEQEVRRLKKELARVTEEREILKKATAFFAKHQ